MIKLEKRTIVKPEFNKDLQDIPVVGKFEKVSEAMYNLLKKYNNSNFCTYDKLKLPSLATKFSAGADFYLPYDVVLRPNESAVIDTCIRCWIIPGWFFALFPKSGLGFKYNVKLANTVGIVDADYYYSQTDDETNEGHIRVKLINGPDHELQLNCGAKFCQGIFLPYGISYTENLEEKDIRNGGIGSTEV